MMKKTLSLLLTFCLMLAALGRLVPPPGKRSPQAQRQ